MKTIASIVFLVCLFVVCVSAQNTELNIIPRPKSVKPSSGNFRLTHKTKLVAFDETGRKTAGLLNDLLMKQYGFKLEFSGKGQKNNAIIIGGQLPPDKQTPPEFYSLDIAPRGIWLYGDEAGQFYALQTLLQLLPPAFKGSATIPGAIIEDAPRFGYRGMHLDVARHFMPLSFVKKYVDLMATYKFNQFHWHLTDDQGWRIEIKKYPKLTTVGSKRPETMVEKNFNPYKGDGVPVEGFYTQDEIRELVAYAKARRINVIPEIELPGHSSAALAAYPELGCKDNYTYKIQTTWGIFKEVFCPTDTTFGFFEDVLAETIALFPDSPYIHIGGDEVLKDQWKESAYVQDLMKREGLKDEHEVQSYFIRRIEKFINSKGKTIIGWDEILEGGLAPNAVVMSWRGEKGGIEAAKAKHNVIMTPSSALYFDFAQGDARTEPINIGNFLPLETVYNYNPVPKELTADEAKYILGAQANIWTEYIKTPEKVEYMAFPRLMALAEVNWSPLESKNFADFERRLSTHYARLDARGVNYRIPEPRNLKNTLIVDDFKEKVELVSKVPGARIYYTLDGSEPTEKSSEAKRAFEIAVEPNGRVDLKTIVVLPNGRKSSVYTATYLRRKLLAATDVAEKTPGAKLNFYQRGFSNFAELDAATATATRETKTFAPTQFSEQTNKLKDPFAATFDGWINIPSDGIYEFQIDANDAARLAIDNETIIEVVENSDKLTTRYAVLPLAKGLHKFKLAYIQNGGEASLGVRTGVKGTGLRRIGAGELFY